MNGYAQFKDGILFQAVARDASGNAASNRDIYVKIFVLKATSTGELVYAETFQVRSTDEGVFSIVIGNGTRIAGVSSLSLIDWRTSIYFLNLKMDILKCCFL